MYEADVAKRAASLLIVLNGIEINTFNLFAITFFAFNRTKWN